MDYKTFKSKAEGLKEAVFKSRAVKHNAQFTKTVEEIEKYVQKKFNSDEVKMIKDMERPKIDFPTRPVPKIVVNPDGTMIKKK